MFNWSRNERPIYFDRIEIKVDQRSRIESDLIWAVETWRSLELVEIKYKSFV